ncbi:TPA: hypothetical protein ACH3X3_005647 [Trebouxia sp. C0006]
MAMGAAPPGGAVDVGGIPLKGRYARPSKPSPRPTEKGITSQEAVEFAISYAREQQRQREQEMESTGPRTDRERELLGPEEDKHYHCVTRSLPGQLAMDSAYADLEVVADSWSKRSFSGIRALPQVLEHGFRQQSLCDTVSRGKQERQQRSQQASIQHNRLTSSCPAFYDGPSLRASHYMPKGTMRPSSWHIHSDNFGVWPYISSEYSREKEELAKQKRIAHALQMSEKDFVVPSSVLPVKGLCCFGNYEYDLNPYPVERKSKQSTEAREKQKEIPFYPAGYLHYPTDLLRSRFSRQECLAQLEQELAAAWPQAFLQVFENGALLVVVSFDAAVAEQEGDLTGYMNELARLNSVPGSWQLCKSTANWGQVQGGVIHFTLKPTWVSNKVPVAANLSGALPAVQRTDSQL